MIKNVTALAQVPLSGHIFCCIIHEDRYKEELVGVILIVFLSNSVHPIAMFQTVSILDVI